MSQLPAHHRFAGPIVGLLALFVFAGLTAQANVNKPSKTGTRPANRKAGREPAGPVGPFDADAQPRPRNSTREAATALASVSGPPGSVVDNTVMRTSSVATGGNRTS